MTTQPAKDSAVGPTEPVLIEGSWISYVAHQRSLIDDEGTFISSQQKAPFNEFAPPDNARIVVIDWGKDSHKGAAIDADFNLRTTIIPDAYCSADKLDLTDDFVTPETKPEDIPAIWNVSETTFCLGRMAIEHTAQMSITKTALRLDDSRSQDMLLASTVLNLIAIHQTPMVLERDIEVAMVHKVVLVLGLPLNDVRSPQTAKAVEKLKGMHIVSRMPVNGKVEKWHLEILSVIVLPQSRGSLVAATRTLTNDWAYTKKRFFFVRDLGNGDMHEYSLTEGGYGGRRLGDGTVKLADRLIQVVDEKLGITLSRAQAQQALRKREITKGGEPYSIEGFWPLLKTEIDGILTKIGDVKDIRSTFIIFTGGGAALLAREIRTMMVEGYGLVEGVDFLIMPENVAAIANAVGLYALALNEIDRLVVKFVKAFRDLKLQKGSVAKSLAYQNKPGIHKSEEMQRDIAALKEQLKTIDGQLRLHVGQYYPDVEASLYPQQLESAAS